MTAEKDPRIEAVAKLLFTGPFSQMHAEDWEEAKRNRWGLAVESLMAAEDVLRGIDEAAEWEYGVLFTESNTEYWNEQHPREYAKEWDDVELIRRRPAGPHEVVSKEVARTRHDLAD